MEDSSIEKIEFKIKIRATVKKIETILSKDEAAEDKMKKEELLGEAVQLVGEKVKSPPTLRELDMPKGEQRVKIERVWAHSGEEMGHVRRSPLLVCRKSFHQPAAEITAILNRQSLDAKRGNESSQRAWLRSKRD